MPFLRSSHSATLSRREPSATNVARESATESRRRKHASCVNQAAFLLSDFFVHRNGTSLSRSATQTPPVVATPPALGRGVPPLILMADGDAVSRDVREAQLRTAGFRVSVARTGFEAIVKASYHLPDVILLDESVAGIEAAEALRMLRTCPMTAHIPVVRLLRGRRLAQRTLSRLRRVAA